MTAVVLSAPARRSAETRARLLTAARTLFARYGYHAVRPQDVAREAGVAQGTFYQYFDDKLACFLAFSQQVDAELGAAVQIRLEGAADFEDRLARAVETVLDYADAHPRELMAVMADARMLTAEGSDAGGLFERWAGFWAQVLEHGQREGRVRADLDLRLAGASVLGVLRQATDSGAGHGASRKQLAEHIRRFVIMGVCA